MKASFVVVNYNRKDELLITITKTKELVKQYQGTYEIVIVDNGSTDGSAEAMAATFPDVTLVAKQVNTGVTAWNDGFAIAKGDYFIVIDDDSHVESGLEEALYYMEARPKIGILALNVLTGPYTSAGWHMQEDKNIVGFIGCGAILRKTTIEKVGGYADWIFLYVNEWELGLRCLNAGYNVQFFENCWVIHRTSSINRTTKRLTVFVTKHELGIVYKYFPRQRWRYIVRIILHNLKIVKGGEFKKAWFTLIGVREFLKMRSSLTYTPVDESAQDTYIRSFPGTRHSAFEFIRKRFRKEQKQTIEPKNQIA